MEPFFEYLNEVKEIKEYKKYSKKSLITLKGKLGWNSLHFAIAKGKSHLELLKQMIEMYNNSLSLMSTYWPIGKPAYNKRPKMDSHLFNWL